MKIFIFFTLISISFVLGKKVPLDEVAEGACTELKKVQVRGEWVKQVERKGWYVPLMSKHFAYHSYEVFQGAIFDDERYSLDKFCLRVLIDWPYINYTGFNVRREMICRQKVEFCEDQVSHKVHRGTKADGTYTVVSSDQKSYVLYVRCVEEDAHQDWFVMSLTPELPPLTRINIFEVLRNHGFDTANKLVEIKYNTCALEF